MPNSDTRSDREVICEWMEPKPTGKRTVLSDDGWKETASFSEHCWWMWYPHAGGSEWIPIAPLTLDRLHLVEKRLTNEQWSEYEQTLIDVCRRTRDLIHASAAQKERALAAVLRGEGK